MPSPDLPESPGGVPEEFAAAYRRAFADELATAQAGDAPRRSAPLLPLAFAFLALVLVLVAGLYALLATGGPDGVVAAAPDEGAAATTPRDQKVKTVPEPGGAANTPVVPVDIASVRAGCTMPDGQDAAGNAVSYLAANAVDGRLATAWRCPGRAVGQRLVLHLSGEVEVAEVGLVPGYAKTDARSGADRYAENNRISLVRWTLADGVVLEQKLVTDAFRRGMQTLRVPQTATDQVVLEIRGVTPGPRDTTAISEVRIGSVRE